MIIVTGGISQKEVSVERRTRYQPETQTPQGICRSSGATRTVPGYHLCHREQLRQPQRPGNQAISHYRAVAEVVARLSSKKLRNHPAI